MSRSASTHQVAQDIRATQIAQAKHHYPWQIFTGTGLKWIAIVTMLIDHTAAILVWTYYLQLHGQLSPDAALWYDIYTWMRRIGRIAFPLFCFALVEGFIHTHSRSKYAIRLFGFALVSEIPFDFALNNGHISYLSDMNVIFTLLIAFLALWVADLIGNHALKLPEWGTGLLTVVMVLAGGWLANIMDVDYHAFGVYLIGGLYLARRSRIAQVAIAMLLTWWYCIQHGSWLEMYNVVGLVCILMYNGGRGRGMKYFFYLFYPLHLLLLGALKLWLF